MNLQTEPSLIIGAVTALITAGVPLLARTFGWTDDLTADWETFLLAAWTVIAVIVGATLTRSRVFSPATHEADVAAAKE